MSGTAATVTLAIACSHLAALAYLTARRDLDESRQRLATSLLFTLPGAGIVLALIAARVSGRGDSPAFAEPMPPRTDRSTEALLLTDQPPLVHRLLGPRSDRLAALSELSRSPTPESVASIRWVIERGDTEAVVDAALTLEQMIEQGLTAANLARKSADDADAAALLRAANRIGDMVTSELADPSIAPRLGRVARELFQRAESMRGNLAADHALAWARLELRAMQPRSALEVLDRCTPSAEHTHGIEALRADVEFAARIGEDVADR